MKHAQEPRHKIRLVGAGCQIHFDLPSADLWLDQLELDEPIVLWPEDEDTENVVTVVFPLRLGRLNG